MSGTESGTTSSAAAGVDSLAGAGGNATLLGTDTVAATQGTDTTAAGNAADTLAAGTAADSAAAAQAADAVDLSGLKVPDGFTLAAPVLDSFKAIAAEAGIKADQAQKLLDLYTGHEAEKARAWGDQVEAWHAEIVADPKLGGANLPATTEACARVMARYGTPELKDLLNHTGFGNHPVLVRMFAAIGAELAPDAFVNDGRAAAPNPLAVLYPTMTTETR